MSNAIQLAFDQGQPGQTLPAMPTPWANGGLGAPAPTGGIAPETTPFTKVHRLLRGRYLLAFVLALLGATLGAAAGFFSQKPAYRSEVTLEFDPIIRKSEDTEKVMVMFQTYIAGQMLKMRDERVLRAAMMDPRWKAVRPNTNPDSDLAAFAENLKVTLPPKSPTFVVVAYADTAPDAKKVAPIAAACVVDAYLEIYGDDDPRGLQKRIDHWKGQQTEANNDIQSRRHQIETLSKNGEDDPMMIRAHDEELIRVQTELRGFVEILAAAETDLNSIAQNAVAKPTVEDWALVDVTMEGHVKLRNELQLRLDSLTSQLGPNHRIVHATRQDLETRQAYMNKYAEERNQKFVIRWSPDGSGGKMIPRNLDGHKLSVQRLRDLQERLSKKVMQMRQNAALIATAKQEITQLGFKVTEAVENLRELNFQKENVGQAKVLSVDDNGRPMGTMPVPDKDRRPLFAAAGFLGGAGLPIGLLMLIGLLDSRYRYSDETAGGPATSGLNLLGILPNLPDRLSDPEQAAIAAHCVHQIRTMLQINHAADGRERRVFAVTSASPGDGKTSLTLALGLSYAACGTRTLLIDCDLIGGGLTSRMNVDSAEGVLEAIANRNLLHYVRQTDIADVALLPVGSAGNLHASTLSPQALRRLIEEAEKHYETILIDTGPILGSIEASLVCAAADAVILAVSRGQQRPMVEKSLSHLAAIGAKLAGVVFNRAQAHDFERSISGASMRSVGIHGPRASTRAGRLGPVARAVAGENVAADKGE